MPRRLGLPGQYAIVIAVDHHACLRVVDLGQIREMNPIECAKTHVRNQNVRTADIQLVARCGEFAQRKDSEATGGDDRREFRNEDRVNIDDQRAAGLMSGQWSATSLQSLRPTSTVSVWPTAPVCASECGKVLSEVWKFDRLHEVRCAGFGRRCAKDRIVVAGNCHEHHLRMVLPREMNELQAVVLSQPNVDDQDVCSVLSEKCACILELVERNGLVSPGVQNASRMCRARLDRRRRRRSDGASISSGSCPYGITYSRQLASGSALSLQPNLGRGRRGTAGTAGGNRISGGNSGTSCSRRRPC